MFPHYNQILADKISMKRLLFLSSQLFFIGLFFVGCATKKPVEQSSSKTYSPPPPVIETLKNFSVNMNGLKNDLGLQRAHESLGYQEKTFKTCQVGNGYPSDRNCQTKHLVVIHFQLMCRDSEGTISTILTLADLQPLAQRPVIWTLKDQSNTVQTDSLGYGQISVITSAPQNHQRLKLSVGNDFLYMKAGEITRVATPPSWCEPFTSASK